MVGRPDGLYLHSAAGCEVHQAVGQLESLLACLRVVLERLHVVVQLFDQADDVVTVQGLTLRRYLVEDVDLVADQRCNLLVLLHLLNLCLYLLVLDVDLLVGLAHRTVGLADVFESFTQLLYLQVTLITLVLD